jgi:hypothetical protein
VSAAKPKDLREAMVFFLSCARLSQSERFVNVDVLLDEFLRDANVILEDRL